MLTNTARLKGFAIQATDGELGTVDQLYFDDKTWGIRYLVVENRLYLHYGRPPFWLQAGHGSSPAGAG
jgi:hypothetical protein